MLRPLAGDNAESAMAKAIIAVARQKVLYDHGRSGFSRGTAFVRYATYF